jgi:LmbE family N-acetylglucosaminyl deacetylase
MKPTPTSPAESPGAERDTERMPLVAFGAHPDDIEFGCGGVVARETRAGRAVHFVLCSKGEAGSYGTPEQRVSEAEEAAKALGATLEFIQLDGDARLEVRAAHSIKLAGILRRLRPSVVFAPSLVENQHPDHARLGRLVQDASRLARYGGIAELRGLPRHAIENLFYYAVTSEAEPRDITPVLFDVSAPDVVAAWTAAMAAHASQVQALNYIEQQMTRAKLFGHRAGVALAIALYPNDPIVLDSLAPLERGTRGY